MRTAELCIFPSGGGGEDQRLAVGRNCGSNLTELGIDFRAELFRRAEFGAIPTREKDVQMARGVVAIGGEVERAVGCECRIEVGVVVFVVVFVGAAFIIAPVDLVLVIVFVFAVVFEEICMCGWASC